MSKIAVDLVFKKAVLLLFIISFIDERQAINNHKLLMLSDANHSFSTYSSKKFLNNAPDK